MMPWSFLVQTKWSHTIDFRHSLVEINDCCLVLLFYVCSSLRVSDKTGILSWCTARVTLFSFAQAATVPFRATETLDLTNLYD